MRSKKGLGTLHNGYRRFQINGKKVLEHRIVMEKKLGRKLEKHETVHHKNLDRLDNSPENLELWCGSQPTGARVEDKQRWAYDYLKKYPIKWPLIPVYCPNSSQISI